MTARRFPPSIQRLKKARRDGKIVKSRLVVVFAGWLSFSAFLSVTHPWVRIGTLIQWFKFKVLTPGGTLKHSLLITGALLIVGIGSVAVAGVLTSVLQTKGLVATKQIMPDLMRVQPGGYARRVRENCIEAIFGTVRFCVVIALLAPVLLGYLWDAQELFRVPGEWVVPVIKSYLVSAWMRALLIMAVIGACAYLLVWRRFMREHRMSFEEVREEYKESEGDPHLRAARKQEHVALAMQEIEKRVRNSKVLVIRRMPQPSRER